VPIDDTHHFKIYVAFVPFEQIKESQGSKLTLLQVPDEQETGVQPAREGYEWNEATGWIVEKDQDRMVQESQGSICDRTKEHLGASDEGVIMLRRLFLDSIKAVEQGRDPHGVIRDPAKNHCLNLPTSVAGRLLK
jgi:5,5'-dehydrodivanillate O-demethylase